MSPVVLSWGSLGGYNLRVVVGYYSHESGNGQPWGLESLVYAVMQLMRCAGLEVGPDRALILDGGGGGIDDVGHRVAGQSVPIERARRSPTPVNFYSIPNSI